MCATNRGIPRVWNPNIPLKEMRIPAAVKKDAEKKANTHAIIWLVWLQEHLDTILVRVFAAKKYRIREHWGGPPRYGLNLYEVIRELIGSSLMVVRNIWYQPMCGWQCYFPADNEVMDCDWRTLPTDERPGVWMQLVNPEAVTECERFRYCGWSAGSTLPLCEYLNAWIENPGVEYFGKIGLRPKKSLVNKAMKDGNFRKWLRTLTPMQIMDANIYGPNATLAAYKCHCSIDDAYSTINDHRQRQNRIRCYAKPVMKYFSAERIEEYLTNEIPGRELSHGNSYRDYIDACVYLHLDLKDTKVAFPRDFKRMHDLRIDEMHSRKAKEDREKRRQLYKDFKTAAEGLKRFEQAAAVYCIIIPTSPADLTAEGDKLKHCVGKMGYDKKMAEGRDFIAFLRKADHLRTPYVTLEYDLKEKRLRQCYGAHDSKPDEATQAFANAWAEMVTETLREEERERRRAEAEAAAEEERQRIARRKEATA